MAGEETSLKQLIQGLAPESIGLCEGVVISASPLSIQVVNNPKMVVSGITLAVPRHLTDYVTTCSVSTVSNGSLIGKTKPEQLHTHSNPEGGNTGSGQAHEHQLDSVQWIQATITIHNTLKIGETVWMLRLGNGEKYYVLDRKEEFSGS